MEVSENVKSAYMGTGKTKYITLDFPQLDLSIATGDGRIHSESLNLSEKLVDSNSIEFVGCIASKFKVQVNNLKEDIKGRKISVSIHTDGTETEPVPLFSGIVDSAVRQSNKRVKEITAYDELYTRGKKDVAAWYKALAFPRTLKQVRDSLFEYIGLEQIETDLPNDGIEIKRKYNPSSLRALPVIKAICQINGVFGIINRSGIFEYRILGNIEESDDGPYPMFYPSPDTFQGVSLGALGLDGIDTTEFSFYKDVNYEEFKVKPVDRITIRQSDSDEGATYGSGTNNYIIQGNMFAYGLSKDTLLQIAENIYPNIQGFSYHPFTSVNNGLPYIECGLDAVSYQMIDFDATEENGEVTYRQQNFYVLNRELTGIQALKDSYRAQGEEYQSEFITDLQTQIDILKKKNVQEIQQQIEDYTYSRDEIDNMFTGSSSGGVKVVSVPELPAETDANTIYLIQGEVTVE